MGIVNNEGVLNELWVGISSCLFVFVAGHHAAQSEPCLSQPFRDIRRAKMAYEGKVPSRFDPRQVL